VKKFLEWLDAGILLVMFLATVTQIVFRILLRLPASWSVELARYLFVLIVFVGAAALMKDEAHIRIGAMTDRLPKTGQKVLRVIARLLIIPFVMIMTWGAYLNMVSTWQAVLPTIEWIRIGYIYLSICLCGMIMLFYLVSNLVYEFRRSPASSANE
jgi:TRAP-type C4-dicarboxylate transport system permease small subunit